MISSDDIASYFANPDSIPEKAVADLGSLSEKHPYCNSLHLLYLKGLALHQGIDFEEVLQRSSAHALDREHLYYLITGEEIDDGRQETEDRSLVTEETVSSDNMVETEEIEEEPEVSTEELAAEKTEEGITKSTETEEIEEEIEAESDFAKASSDMENEEKTEEGITEESDDEVEVLDKEVEEDALFELETDIITEAATIAYELETEEIIQEELGEEALEDNIEFVVEETEDGGQETEEQDYAETSPDEESDHIEASSIEEIDYENLSFIQWLKLKQGRPIDEEEEVYFDSDEEDEDLVDKFIREEPSITRPKKIEFYDPVKNAQESLVENTNIVSETLAEVHIQQKNFGKAIETYEQLMLLYPEKKAIFATRIEEINARLR